MNEIADNQPLTPEEIVAIYDTCILPMVLPIIKRNRTGIASDKHILTNLYVKSTDVLIAQIARDIIDAKRILSHHSITVQDGPHSEGSAKYRYSCRGYEGEFEITRDYAKAEIGSRIAKYIANLVNVEKRPPMESIR